MLPFTITWADQLYELSLVLSYTTIISTYKIGIKSIRLLVILIALQFNAKCGTYSLSLNTLINVSITIISPPWIWSSLQILRTCVDSMFIMYLLDITYNNCFFTLFLIILISSACVNLQTAKNPQWKDPSTNATVLTKIDLYKELKLIVVFPLYKKHKKVYTL